MAWDALVWIALLAAVVAIALMVNLTRAPKEAAPAAAPAPAAPGVAPEAAQDDLLLRFVVNDRGERQGETVAVEGDKVVVKGPDGFLLVPLAQLKPEGGNVRLVEPLDWEAAKREGEAWRERSHKVISYSPDELPKDEG